MVRLRSRAAAGGLALITVGLLAGCGTVGPSVGGHLQPTPTPNANASILPPAYIASAVGVCSAELTYAADGSAGPLFCGGQYGDGTWQYGTVGLGLESAPVNELAWDYYSPMNGSLFTAGPDTTAAEAQALVCANPGGTIPITSDTYYLAAAYYGWNFAVDPTLALTDGGC